MDPVGQTGDNDPKPDDMGKTHGSSVTGIAAATTDNGIGIAGVSFRCRFLPIRLIYGPEGVPYICTRLAILYAEEYADVINTSWGGYDDFPAERDAFQHAVTNGREGKGCVITCGVGNDNSDDNFYPAAFPFTIGVGAVKSDDNRWEGSNYGSQLDVMAPGGDDEIWTLGNMGVYVSLTPRTCRF